MLELLSQGQSDDVQGTECDVCKDQSAKVANMIRTFSRDDLEDKLLELCGYMGSYSDACRATVVDDFNTILK